MRVFAPGIKLPNVAAVQRPHDADARKRRRSARRRDQNQRFHGRLPLCILMLGFRQLSDVIAGVLERDEVSAARQRYRIVERSLPTTVSH